MNIENIKSNLRDFYNAEAEHRNAQEKHDFKKLFRERICELILGENKKTLLEIGAGPGHDSKFFMERGLNVTADDMSCEMVKICREKGIDAYELDFYNLSALQKKFDCVWAMNSLLHVPKNDLHEVLQNISATLNENGLFYMGVWGGEDKEKEHINEICNTPRFFSLFSKEKLAENLQLVFEILSFEQLDNVDKWLSFQSVIMRKKNV
jgi:SAM-dependent methyltransferase